eukprot:TRINITY_DN2187_c0_g1_i2.p2 TRINITY_DN2187_c0_g1~~TRINITY_DN2187_c0_g1_i2.p2  ORF type:complete len:155 (+),score=18.84 TRINITY_DN2187_c0_g1_i2:458-922(+)
MVEMSETIYKAVDEKYQRSMRDPRASASYKQVATAHGKGVLFPGGGSNVVPEGLDFMSYVSLWIDFVKQESDYPPVLIIDEAHEPFSAEGSLATDVRQALNRLTQLSKEQQLLNVLLVSSEFSERYNLGALGFNTANLTRIEHIRSSVKSHLAQ